MSKKQFLSFDKLHDAQEWLNRYYGSWSENIDNKDLREAVFSYCGGAYTIFNNLLINKDCDTYENMDEREYFESIKLQIRILKAEIYKHPISENIVVYRSIMAKRIFVDKDMFFSTSLSKESAYEYCRVHNNNLMLKINVPKGLCALYTGIIGEMEHEAELLFPPEYKLIITKKYFFKKPKVIECQMSCE